MIRDYYGIVVHFSNLQKMIRMLGQINDGETEYGNETNGRIMEFLEKHNLIDIRKEKKGSQI